MVTFSWVFNKEDDISIMFAFNEAGSINIGNDLNPSSGFFVNTHQKLSKFLPKKIIMIIVTNSNIYSVCILLQYTLYFNLYLNIFAVVEFQHSIALWKAYDQIAQFLQSNFAQILANTPLKGICTFFFLEYTFRFQKKVKHFLAYLNFWLLKNVEFVVFCAIFVFYNFC